MHAMKVVRTIDEARDAIAELRRGGETIGFVPTMGALHAGHTSLIEHARNDGHAIVVSVFVNPKQFGVNEDADRYPRDEAADFAACRRERVALIFAPSAAEMYPGDFVTGIHVAELTKTLCGPFRPGHFDGVATVVAKLFGIVQPDAAYFGRKDAQQLAVVRRLTRDLNLPVEIVGCPTVREPDGLAMSSRNRYLTGEQRSAATRIYAALDQARRSIADGIIDVARLETAMRRTLLVPGMTTVDYASIVDAETLEHVPTVDRPVLIAAAVRIGAARLIDNVRVDPAAMGE